MESIFCLLLVMEAFSLQKVVKMLEEVVVGWREVRWIWWMRQNFLVQFVQLLKCWLCKLQLGIVVQNWAPSVAQCQLQALQFPVYHQLLSILLTCNGFPGDSGGCSGSDGQQTTKQWPWLFFFLVQVWLWKVLWSFLIQPLSWSSLVVIYSPLFIAHHNPIKKWFVVMQNKRRWHFKSIIFWFAVSLCVHACQVTSVVSNSATLWTVAHQGILQTRILEWVAMLSSRGYSWPRGWMCISYVSCIGRWVLYC